MKSKKATPLIFVAAIIFWAFVESVSATPITIDFTGVVTESTAGLYAYPPGYVPISGPEVGDPFSGSITYLFDSPFSPSYAEASIAGLFDYRIQWFETPTGIGVAGDWVSYRGSILLSLNAAEEVVGGTFSFTGTPFDRYADFGGVINHVPDSSSTLTLMAVGFLALAAPYHKGRPGRGPAPKVIRTAVA